MQSRVDFNYAGKDGWPCFKRTSARQYWGHSEAAERVSGYKGVCPFWMCSLCKDALLQVVVNAEPWSCYTISRYFHVTEVNGSILMH